jgi:hypothetical protein
MFWWENNFCKAGAKIREEQLRAASYEQRAISSVFALSLLLEARGFL